MPSTSGNVRVVARIRPLAKYEIGNGSKEVVTSLNQKAWNLDERLENEDKGKAEPGGPEVVECKDPNASGGKRWFELDGVFDKNCSQEELYHRSGARNAVVNDIFSGYNATILAYGQTGSGKTYSMGSAAAGDRVGDHDGIIPRACLDLFRTIAEKCDGNAKVEMSYLEIYNEEIRDLLGSGKEEDQKKLKVHETLNGEVYVSNLTAKSVVDTGEIGKFMDAASGKRMVAATAMNATSSRSHAICTLLVSGVISNEDETKEVDKFTSKLTLVDLAGSEKLGKTGATGGRAKEGININKGLFVLGQVVSALGEAGKRKGKKGSVRPPFRDSKLTRLLQNSLGGNSRTIMVACMSPADYNVEETVSTLRYATSARNIKNSATRNIVKTISPEEAAALQRDNQLLRTQVEELQAALMQMQYISSSGSVATTACSTVISSASIDMAVKTISAKTRKVKPPGGKHDKKSAIDNNITTIDTKADKADIYDDNANSTPETPSNISPADNYEVSLNDKPNERESIESTVNSLPTTSVIRPSTGKEIKDVKIDDEDISVAESALTMPVELLNAQNPQDDRRIKELEMQVKKLKKALKLSKRDVRKTAGKSAIELPSLKVELAKLRDELADHQAVETENDELRVELEEVKSDAMAAKLAAAKLSDIMDQLAKLKQDEMALKKAELDHMKKEEAWVEFVQRLMVRFEEQVEGLGEDFDLVLRVVDSPAVLKPHERKTWFGKSKAQFQDMFDPELRERVLKEHVNFFKERVVEMLNEVVIHTVSLGSMKDGIQRRCLTLKDQIGHDEVIAEQIGDGIEKGDHNTLEDLAKMLLSADASAPAHQASTAKMEKRVSLVEKQGLKRGKSERKNDEAGKSESRRSVTELSGVDEENIDEDDDDGAFSSWGNGAANTS